MHRLQEINPLYEKYGHLSLAVFGVGVLLLGLLLRSDFFLSIVDFVLELLGWAGILGGAAIAAAGVVAYGSEKGWWDRLIEGSGQSGKRFPMVRGLSSSALFLLVLLFFFLPWASVSCLGEELLTVSGADIMGITQADNIPSDLANDDYDVGDALSSDAALLYVAALLVIVGGAVFFLSEGRGSYLRAGFAVAGLLSLLAYVFLTLSSAASDLGVGITELDQVGLEITWKPGFWLSVLALLVVTVLQFIPMPSTNDALTPDEDSDTSL